MFMILALDIPFAKMKITAMRNFQRSVTHRSLLFASTVDVLCLEEGIKEFAAGPGNQGAEMLPFHGESRIQAWKN